MKRLIFVLLLLPALVMPAQRNKKVQNIDCSSGNCPAKNTLNINTGIDPNTGDVLPIGSVDPAWQLLNYPPLTGNTIYPVNIPNAIVINAYQSGWNVIPGSGILSSISSSSFSDNNQFANQPWRFKRSFCVCKNSRVKISGVMRADDKGSIHVYDMNGVELYAANTVNGWAFNVDNPFETTLNLPAGSYIIEFHMINSGGGGTGFSVGGQIESLDGQNVLLNSSNSCCSNNSFISVQKILETKECNGKTDNGEIPGSGWTFDLKDSDGQTIQTQTTDHNGELIFNGLEAGTYTVLENNQSGWIANQPPGGSQQVTVSENGGTTLKFYNCKGKETQCCSGKNLVVNGDFEQGNEGFSSEFLFTPNVLQSSVVPGKYSVITGAEAAIISPTWASVQDPSSCTYDNGKFLATNGQNGGGPLQRTGEPVPPKKVIWEQTFNINTWAHYKFCFKAKNLNQVGFPITPMIDVKFNHAGIDDILDREIDSPSDPCAWLDIEKGFNAWGNGNGVLKVQIILDQSRHGDGNDIAIDNIALLELESCPPSVAYFEIHTQPNDGYFNVTANGTTSDECNSGFWEVCEINPSNMECVSDTKVSNPQPWWSNSTTFIGYDGDGTLSTGNDTGHFDNGKLFKITRGVWGDCKAWNQYSIIVGTPPGSNRVMEYTEQELKAKKQEILRTFNKAKPVPKRRN